MIESKGPNNEVKETSGLEDLDNFLIKLFVFHFPENVLNLKHSIIKNIFSLQEVVDLVVVT